MSAPSASTTVRDFDDTPVTTFSLANALLRQRHIIAWSIAVCVGVGAAFAVVPPRRYTSVTTFMPQSRKLPNGIGSLAAQFGVAVPTGDGALSPPFYAELVESHEIVRAVATRRYRSERGGHEVTDSLAAILDVDAGSPALRLEKTIDLLRRRTEATVQQRSGVVRLTVTAPEPSLATALVGAYLDELTRFNFEMRRSQASAERKFTEQRMAEAQDELRAAEGDLLTFRNGNRVVDAASLRLTEDRLERAVSMRQQLYTSLAQSYDQARLDEVRDTPVITTIDPPTFPVKPDTRGLVGKSLAGLLVGFGIGAMIAWTREQDVGVVRSIGAERDEFRRNVRRVAFDLLRPWRLFVAPGGG